MDSISDYLMSTFKGSPFYIAPEFYDDEIQYTNKVDIFAIAIIIYQMLCRQKPYPKFNNSFILAKAVGNGLRPDLSYIKN